MLPSSPDGYRPLYLGISEREFNDFRTRLMLAAAGAGTKPYTWTDHEGKTRVTRSERDRILAAVEALNAIPEDVYREHGSDRSGVLRDFLTTSMATPSPTAEVAASPEANPILTDPVYMVGERTRKPITDDDRRREYQRLRDAGFLSLDQYTRLCRSLDA